MHAKMIYSYVSTHLAEWQDDEGSSSAGVHDHGHEFGVDGAEVAVPRHLGDPDVIVALVCLHGLAEDVAELAGSDDFPGHDELRRRRRGRSVREQESRSDLKS